MVDIARRDDGAEARSEIHSLAFGVGAFAKPARLPGENLQQANGLKKIETVAFGVKQLDQSTIFSPACASHLRQISSRWRLRATSSVNESVAACSARNRLNTAESKKA